MTPQRHVSPRPAPSLLDLASIPLFGQLRAAFGVDFAQYKRNTIERRIGRRMALNKLDRVEDYLSLLAANPTELRGLHNDLLIGVTSFFRDAEPFEALKNIVAGGGAG